MSEEKPPVNRIPHESFDNDAVSSWSLPAMKGAIKKVSNDIRTTRGMHIRGREGSSVSNIKESIDVVEANATPTSLTAEDLKQITEDAHKDGYSEGYAEGLRKGTEKGVIKGTQQGKEQAYKETKAEMIELQNRLRDISINLLTPLNEQDQALENIVVEMAFYFAQSLIETEIKQSPSALYSIVNKALSAMPVGSQNISVRLNDSDADLLENLLSKTDRNWNIQRDDKLKSGGCIVESKESLVNYSVESRIEKFIEEAQIDTKIKPSEQSDVKTWREKDISADDEGVMVEDDTAESVKVEKKQPVENPETLASDDAPQEFVEGDKKESSENTKISAEKTPEKKESDT